MLKFIVKRILYAIPTILITVSIVFVLMRLLPNNPIYNMVDMDEVTEEQIAELEEQYGINDPIWKQYLNYMGDVFTGNWGRSFFNEVPVFENITSRLEPTLMMTVLSTLITFCIGVPIGILCATRRNSVLDYAMSSGAIVFMAVPSFWLGLLMIYFLAFKMKWFPIEGYRSIAKYGFWSAVYSIILPSIALGMSHVASIARQTRSSMLNVLNTDYIRTARAKGLSEHMVHYKHALKNTMSLIATLIGSTVGGLLGGSTVIENVFNIQGVGKLSHQALMRLDYYQEQADTLFTVLIIVAINIILDIVYKLLDPRIDI